GGRHDLIDGAHADRDPCGLLTLEGSDPPARSSEQRKSPVAGRSGNAGGHELNMVAFEGMAARPYSPVDRRAANGRPGRDSGGPPVTSRPGKGRSHTSGAFGALETDVVFCRRLSGRG